MKTTIRIFAVAAIVSAVALTAPARAGSIRLCGDDCVELTVQNNALATVLAVKIVQKDGTQPCERIEKVRRKNLAGDLPGEGGEYFSFHGTPSCTYHVTFKTTSGCAGDKEANLTPEKMAGGETTAELVGGCGTLRAKTRNNAIVR